MLEEVSGKAHNLEVGGSNPPSATTICVLSSAVEHLVYTERVGGSTPSGRTSFIRSVAQSGSAPGLGPGGPRFESLYSDHFLGC